MTNPKPDIDTLLLDFGGVCLLSPVELHSRCEQLLNLEPGSLTWHGPIDPSTDALWREMVAGTGLTEREYWAERAQQVGELAGRPMKTRDYMNLLYHPPSDDLVRPECTAVVAAAQAAGFGVSVLTNDLRAFHGPDWEKEISLLQRVDVIVDCSDTNVLKPDPRAYQRAVDLTDTDPGRMLFVDDQPTNVEGAIAFGIETLWFDVANPVESWNAVTSRLELL